MIAQWKKKAQEDLPALFAKKADNNERDIEDEVKALHRKVGQLTMENDFLSKAYGR